MGQRLMGKVKVGIFAAALFLLVAMSALMLVGDNVTIQSERLDTTVTTAENVAVSVEEDTAAPIGEVWEYRFMLDERLTRDIELAFSVSHHDVDISLDGVPVYSLHTAEYLSSVKTTGHNWVMLPLNEADGGKEVCVTLAPVYQNYSGRDVKFLLGSAAEIYRMVLSDSLPELALGFANLIAGVLMLGIAAYYYYYYYYRNLARNRYSNIFWSGLLAISVALWRISDSDFVYLLAGRLSVLSYSLSITMLTAMAALLCAATRTQFRPAGQRMLSICGVVSTLFFMVQIALQLLGILDLRETLTMTHILLAAASLLVFANCLYELFAGEKRKTRVPRYTAWLIALGVLVDLIIYYIGKSSAGLLFVQAGVLGFVILEGLRFLYSFTTQEQQLAEKELQLLQSRSTTLMSQIRSHFVFNLLNAISGMCKSDPEKADETVVRFSRYLRSNIDIMQEDTPVPFPVALQHLEDYIILEQIRFGDSIRFETDIQEELFLLPPLLLQPLVENAIKHGLRTKPGGGTITLHTCAEGENIVITIADDGVGFDPAAPCRAGAVGLDNIRFRLEHMAQGYMTIDSEPGQGTCVTLTLPRKETAE